MPLVSFAVGAALQHGVHPVARIPDRQHRSHRALRAADRHADPVSDARRVRDCSFRSRHCRRCSAAVARALPLTYAVSLLRGIWQGDGWLAHTGDVAVLAAMFFLLHCDLGQSLPLGVKPRARNIGGRLPHLRLSITSTGRTEVALQADNLRCRPPSVCPSRSPVPRPKARCSRRLFATCRPQPMRTRGANIAMANRGRLFAHCRAIASGPAK